MNTLCDRFSSTEAIDLLPRLRQRVQRPAGNHLERINEAVLLLQSESQH